MRMNFDDGRELLCRFEAMNGMAVRYVVENGQGGISVNDEPTVFCSEYQPMEPSP